MGRTSTYDADLADTICERVMTRSLHAVCLDTDMPAEGTVYGWLAAETDFAEKYARARKARAYHRVDHIDSVVEEMRAGRLDPAAARVAIDAIKWQASKENSGIFGDKLEVESKGTLGVAVTIQRLSDVPAAAEPGDGA